MPTYVPLEALYLVVGGLIVPPKENAVCKAAILYLSCHHHYKGVKPFRGKINTNIKGSDFNTGPLYYSIVGTVIIKSFPTKEYLDPKK